MTGEGIQAPCGCPHRKLKLESTDFILSSPHAKKLVSFFTRIFRRYKLEYKLLMVQFKINYNHNYSPISSSTACGRPPGEGGLAHVEAFGQRERVKNPIFVDVIMAP